MADTTTEIPSAATESNEHNHNGPEIACSQCGRDPDEDEGIVVDVPLGGDSPTCNICIEEHIIENTSLPKSQAEPIAYKLLGKTVGEAADLLVARRGDDAPAQSTVKGYYKKGMKKAHPGLETYFATEPFIDRGEHEVAEYDPEADTKCDECGNRNEFEEGIVVNTPPDGEGGLAEVEICNICLEEFFIDETELPERQAQVIAYRWLGLSHTQVHTTLDARLGGEGPSLGAVKTYYNRAIEKGKTGLTTYSVLAPLHEQPSDVVHPAF